MSCFCSPAPKVSTHAVSVTSWLSKGAAKKSEVLRFKSDAAKGRQGRMWRRGRPLGPACVLSAFGRPGPREGVGDPPLLRGGAEGLLPRSGDHGPLPPGPRVTREGHSGSSTGEREPSAFSRRSPARHVCSPTLRDLSPVAWVSLHVPPPPVRRRYQLQQELAPRSHGPQPQSVLPLSWGWPGPGDWRWRRRGEGAPSRVGVVRHAAAARLWLAQLKERSF